MALLADLVVEEELEEGRASVECNARILLRITPCIKVYFHQTRFGYIEKVKIQTKWFC